MKIMLFILSIVIYVIIGSGLESLGFKEPAFFMFIGVVYGVVAVLIISEIQFKKEMTK